MKKLKNDEQNVRGGEKSRTLSAKVINQKRREYIARREHLNYWSVDQIVRNITK